MEQGTDFQAMQVQAPLDSGEAPKRSSRKRLVLFTTSAFLLLLASIAGLIYARKLQEDELLRMSIVQSPTLPVGIYINGVHVGGMHKDAVSEALETTHAQHLQEVSFFMTADEHRIAVDAVALGMAPNTQEVLQQALQLARNGSLAELQIELEDIRTNHRSFTTSYTPDEATVLSFVEEVANKVDREPQDASFAVLVDPKAASDAEKKTAEYVTLSATRTPEQCYTYADPVDGITVDQPALAQALLEKAATGDYSNFEIPLQTTKATINQEDVQGTVTLRGHAYTSFAKSPYNRSTRVFNIKKAVGLINGTKLMPGEVFSTNDTLGNRTYGGGWKPAPAIVRGRSEDQAGGGVCQVSSTLYNCVLKSDLEIVYRQGHSGRLSYVDGGLDATIDSGRIDFKWKNSTNSPIYIFGYVDEEKKEIHFEIHGEPFPDTFDEIQLSSKKISNLSPPGPMQYTVDYSKPAGYSSVYVARKSGSLWEAYATYLKNGQVVKKITLDRTTYKAYAGETIVGPSNVVAAAG